MTPQTLRVVSTDEATQGPFVVINAEDFDPQSHKLWGVPAEDAQETQSDAAPKLRGRPSKTITE